MAVSLVDTLAQLEAMTVTLAQASEASKDERKVMALASKLKGSDVVPLPDSLVAELESFIASHDNVANVDKSEGKAMAKRISTYVAYCESEPEIAPSFDIAHAKSVVDAWAKVGGSMRGSGTGAKVDGPGRVVLEFAYPGGVENVSPVGKKGTYSTRAEQQLIRSSILWEITKRAKALSDMGESEKGAYKWSEKARADWREFYGHAKDGTETQATFTLPVGVDGKGKLVVTATYKV